MADKILIVEDEVSLQETLSYNLKHEGYLVELAGDGLSGMEKARSWKPDLLLLDIMLPIMDGIEVCKTLRNETDIPIIFLSAKADEIDRVVGLEIGADDYVVKPFSMRELLVRVKARLKVFHQLHEMKSSESHIPGKEEKLVFNDLAIDLSRHEVTINGIPLQLKPKEFELLLFLVENRGRAVSRELILDKVWGWDFVGGSRTVDVHIRWLRSKIEKDVDLPARIITVRGAGYRFEG
jgi:DNA-binding response OmpR family regulator